MATNVTEIQNRIATIVDQSPDAPTAGGDDWNLRLKYMNMSQREWSESYPWQVLYKEYNSLTSQPSGNSTLSLPTDFRKISSFPKITADGATTEDYPEIRPQEKDQYSGSDRYCYVIGNYSDGYSLFVNPGTANGNMVSGASIYVPYLATPGSLASPADASMCPDPEYLVQRTVALLWESREDARFPQAKADAEKILARLLELESTHTDAAVYGQVRTIEQKKYNFRWGRNG